MTGLKEHINAREATGNLLTRRFSHHPERYIEIFNVSTGARIVHEKNERSGHVNLRYTSDGRYFIESDMNGEGTGLGVKIWDRQRQKLLQEIPGNIGSLSVSRDGKYLAVATAGKTTIWQFK